MKNSNVFQARDQHQSHAPVGLLLSRVLDLPILPLYTTCRALYIPKGIVGYYFLKKGKWIRNLAVE